MRAAGADGDSKPGLSAAGVREHVGDLDQADIGVPPSLYTGEGLGIEVPPIFSRGDVVQLASD